MEPHTLGTSGGHAVKRGHRPTLVARPDTCCAEHPAAPEGTHKQKEDLQGASRLPPTQMARSFLLPRRRVSGSPCWGPVLSGLHGSLAMARHARQYQEEAGAELCHLPAGQKAETMLKALIQPGLPGRRRFRDRGHLDRKETPMSVRPQPPLTHSLLYFPDWLTSTGETKASQETSPLVHPGCPEQEASKHTPRSSQRGREPGSVPMAALAI